MSETINFIEDNKDRFLSELFDFLKIPSISSDPKYNEETKKAANWLADNFKNSGIKDVTIFETEGHPIVFAQNLDAGESAPTLLIYGHYDVQPVDPLDLWHSEPFQPEIRNGKIFGRGTADDKGQLFTHVKAVESILKTKGKLSANIKFLIEGEEEAGSNHLDDFILTHTELLKCDSVIISDTEWFAEGLPSICYSLRGLSYIEITVTGPNRDLHSGTFGGGVDNPLIVLCKMIARLKDEYGKITIPGFYDDVLNLTEEEREGFKKLPFDYKAWCEDLEIKNGNGEFGFSTLERVWARPTIDLNGIVGGYTGEGAKTILPSKASAKISMRLVPNQNPKDITEKIKKYIYDIAPETVKVEFNALHGGSPVLIPIEGDAIKAAQIALEKAFGVEPVFMREGGSIPIVNVFTKELNAPVVLMGLGLPADNIHSPNESFAVSNYYGGIKASVYFIEEFTKLKQ